MGALFNRVTNVGFMEKVILEDFKEEKGLVIQISGRNFAFRRRVSGVIILRQE